MLLKKTGIYSYNFINADMQILKLTLIVLVLLQVGWGLEMGTHMRAKNHRNSKHKVAYKSHKNAHSSKDLV